MIKFEQSNDSGYAKRTEDNVKGADVTIAFAIDFNTAGEKLTAAMCEKHGKPLLQIKIHTYYTELNRRVDTANQVITFLEQHNAKSINFAGNGLYTLKYFGWFQQQCNWFMLAILKEVTQYYLIDSVRSGGQTGIDEAAIVAANALEIDCTVLAPKGWKFRGADGKDVSNITEFKKRFDVGSYDVGS